MQHSRSTHSPQTPTTSTRRRRPMLGATVLAVGLSLIAAACGSDDDEAADTTPATSATTAAPATTGAPSTTGGPATTSGGAPSGEVIEVVASDYAFGGLPDTIEAGTKLTLTNISDKEAHELVAVRLPDDETRSVEDLLKLSEEELNELVGATMPAAVLLAAPGSSEQIEAVGDGTISEPGRYAIVCSIPVGANPDDVFSEGTLPEDSGPPHFSQGMYAELVVE